jgi:anaerobic selenocysteine-containing dehydrogenase
MQSESQSDKQGFDPQRRNFLKISAAAGATAAAVAVVGPKLVSQLDSSSRKEDREKELSPAIVAGAPEGKVGDPMIIVVRNGSLNVLQGKRGLVMNDSQFTSSLLSQVRSRMSI